MTPTLQFYIILVIVGLFLIGAEIFLPGGVIGVLGVMALAGAMIVGFSPAVFGLQGGLLSALIIVVLVGLCIAAWVKYFPKTSMGRRMTLEKDGKTFKAASEVESLIGKEGVALSILRPSGIAKIDGRRVDVVADGTWIESGKRIKVMGVSGPRVLVREISGTPGGKDSA
ncbi:MAG: NfeD family protein [Verrucomicrobiota bacterium]